MARAVVWDWLLGMELLGFTDVGGSYQLEILSDLI